MTQEESTPGGVSPQDVPTPNEVSPSEKRIDIKLPPAMRLTLDALRQDDEKDAAVVRRIIESVPNYEGRIADLVSNSEHLTKVNTELRETLVEEQNRYLAKFDEYVEEIGQLHARITTLESSGRGAVVPTGMQVGMDSLGIKDVIEETREICGDDDACNHVIGKIIDLKAHFASKAIDHEHTADQNRLDREQKELDRKSKEEQAEKDRKSKEDQAARERASRIELALAKKGGFKAKFLDDVVFLSGGSPKRPGKEIERRKQEAMAAAEDEDDWSDPTAEEELMMPGDSEEVL